MSSFKSAHLTRTAVPPSANPKNESAAKRDVSRLQKAIVDGLEDVKAQNLMVFDTEHLSSLFERVIVASGTSNRQTKALAQSVRDAVSEAGFAKPRMEGEDNGEWIIVDCGPAVVHIMQPAIRQYYHLEDIWGEKPVRHKHAALEKAKKEPNQPVPGIKSAPSATKKVASKTTGTDSGKGKLTTKPAAKKAPAKKSASKASPQAVAKKVAAKKSVAKSAPKKATAKKVAPKKASPKKAA